MFLKPYSMSVSRKAPSPAAGSKRDKFKTLKSSNLFSSLNSSITKFTINSVIEVEVKY